MTIFLSVGSANKLVFNYTLLFYIIPVCVLAAILFWAAALVFILFVLFVFLVLLIFFILIIFIFFVFRVTWAAVIAVSTKITLRVVGIGATIVTHFVSGKAACVIA